MMIMAYEVTIGLIPNCTCPNFFSMLANLKKKGKFVPCKHLYFIKTQMFYDHKINDFINQPTLNINEVKKLLQREIQVG
jgi:predicted nucleic acid-binding Zn finger protein